MKNSPNCRRKAKIGGIDYQKYNDEDRNFAEITPNLPFTEYIFYEEFRGSFEKTELGRMKKILPLREMAESLKLVNKSMMSKRGRKSYFTPEGKVALNGNVFYQMFCDIVIDPAHRAGQGSEERGVWGQVQQHPGGLDIVH